MGGCSGRNEAPVLAHHDRLVADPGPIGDTMQRGPAQGWVLERVRFGEGVVAGRPVEP